MLAVMTMKRIKTLFLILLALASFLPAGAAKQKNTGVVVLKELHNYFHNRDAQLLTTPLVTSREEFDRQFGEAAVMGKGGQPTPVNFRREVVLAIVLPETNRATEIDSVELTETAKGQLTLSYAVHYGSRRSYFTQPMRLFAVSSKYKGFVVRTAPRTSYDVVEAISAYQHVSYRDARHDIYYEVDYPTDSSALGDSLRIYIANHLAAIACEYDFDQKGTPACSMPKTVGDGLSFIQPYIDLTAKNIDIMNRENGNSVARSSLDASISKVWETARFVTYEVKGYVFTGGAHGIGFCSGATFDKTSGSKMQIVKENKELRTMLTDRLHKAWDVDHFSEEPVPMPQADPYVVAGKVKFIYQPYEIGAYAIGMPEVELYPYELDKWLTEEGRKINEQ